LAAPILSRRKLLAAMWAGDLLNAFGFSGDKVGLDAIKNEVPEQFIKIFS